MTVATEACYAEQQYTGTKSTFNLPPAFLRVRLPISTWAISIDGLLVQLSQGLHFSVPLYSDYNVTVTSRARYCVPDFAFLLPQRFIVFSLREAVPDARERAFSRDPGSPKRGNLPLAPVRHLHHREVDTPDPVIRD